MADEVEIRIAAYSGILTEGPCMREGCINRLRRIVELESSQARLIEALRALLEDDADGAGDCGLTPAQFEAQKVVLLARAALREAESNG